MTCQGCGEEKRLNKNQLCRSCQKESDSGAFKVPPFFIVIEGDKVTTQ